VDVARRPPPTASDPGFPHNCYRGRELLTLPAKYDWREVSGFGNLKQLHEIKAQIAWLRDWANFGTDEDRAWREGFIEYLEHLAQRIEERHARASQARHAA